MDDHRSRHGKRQVSMRFAGFFDHRVMDSAKGGLHFSMRQGDVFRTFWYSSAPLQVRRFTGIAMIGKGRVELEQATLESPTTSYSVTGKASDNRKLDFKLIPEGFAGLTVDPDAFRGQRVTAVPAAERRTALKR